EHDREFDPDTPVAPIDLATIRRLLPTDKATAFVQYTLTRDRGFAILITREELQAVPLDDLRLRQTLPLLGDRLRTRYLGKERWPEALPGLLAPIAERAVWHVEDWVSERKIERVVIAPHRALHLFPLHACKLRDRTTYWLDAREVVYTPSLSILHRCA